MLAVRSAFSSCPEVGAARECTWAAHAVLPRPPAAVSVRLLPTAVAAALATRSPHPCLRVCACCPARSPPRWRRAPLARGYRCAPDALRPRLRDGAALPLPAGFSLPSVGAWRRCQPRRMYGGGVSERWQERVGVRLCDARGARLVEGRYYKAFVDARLRVSRPSMLAAARHTCNRQNSRRSITKNVSLSSSRSYITESTKKYAVATLLTHCGSGGVRVRLATLVKAAEFTSLLVESRDSGPLLCGLRLSATLLVVPFAAARRWCRRRLRLLRQSRLGCLISCHSRRWWVLPRRHVISGGRAGCWRRRRGRISRESRDFQSSHAVVNVHHIYLLDSPACRRCRRGSWCKARRQASILHHLAHNSLPVLGALARVTNRRRV